MKATTMQSPPRKMSRLIPMIPKRRKKKTTKVMQKV